MCVGQFNVVFLCVDIHNPRRQTDQPRIVSSLTDLQMQHISFTELYTTGIECPIEFFVRYLPDDKLKGAALWRLIATLTTRCYCMY